MRECTPHVFLVGETKVDLQGIQEYFEYKNKTTGLWKPSIDWKPTTYNDAELLTEFYGRGCYESWDAESTSNMNISKIRSSSRDYLLNIIKSGHGSVLEHAWVNFKFADVSRVFTHELVRHRVGTAISQLSQRYYRSDEYGLGCFREQLVGPNALISMESSDEALEIIVETVENAEKNVKRLVELFNLEEGNFNRKKKLTSILRRIAPDGQATDIGWSANIRTLRHVIESRTNRHAEWEIRYVFAIVGKMMMVKYPMLFGDYKVEVVEGIEEFVTEFGKV